MWPSISSADPRIGELLDRPSYNITARGDRAASSGQLMLMLQTLLEDRFKLKVRREARVEPDYRLAIAANGSRLQESEGNGATSFSPLANGVECRNMPMADFVRYLTGRMGRVVLDMTGLKSRYDFTLKLSIPGLGEAGEALSSNPGPDATKAAVVAAMKWSSSSIFSDIQKQLGLKLEAGRDPVDHLVVDHLEKPTED